jgi:alanyl aminopeptidase
VRADSERAWTIPACVRAQGESTSRCADLALGAPSIIAGRSCPRWVFPNPEGSYYRFALSEAEALTLANARAELDAPQKLALLSNTWAGVRSGRLKPSILLKILPLFDSDPTRQIVEQVVGILSGMSLVLVEDEARPAFRAFVAARLAARKTTLGWHPGPTETTADVDRAALRRTVLWAMGELAEDETTLREASEVTARFLTDHASVDADAASLALDLAARRGTPAHVTTLLDAARDAKTKEERIVALRAMGGFDDREVLEQALNASLSERVRPIEMRLIFGAALGRRTGRVIAEAWIRAHWDELQKRLPGSLGAGLVNAAGVACTKAEVAERTAFYTPRATSIDGATRPLAEALEGAALCAELRAYGARNLSQELLRTSGDGKARR